MIINNPSQMSAAALESGAEAEQVAPEQVYVVRLTEEDRAELEHLARHQWAYSTPPNKPHAKRRLDVLQSASPEHPKRREALEELHEACKDWREERAAQMRVLDALAKLRSLEDA